MSPIYSFLVLKGDIINLIKIVFFKLHFTVCKNVDDTFFISRLRFANFSRRHREMRKLLPTFLHTVNLLKVS